MSKTYDAAYWDGVRAEREAGERAERQAYGEAARSSERLHVKLAAQAVLERAIARAEAQIKEYEAERGIGHAYYRGKTEGLRDGLSLLLGVLFEAEREAGR